MTAITEARSLLKEFVLNSADCSIYTNNLTSKVCFGKDKIVQIMLKKDSIALKIYSLEHGKAIVKISKTIALKSSEMFTVKHHFKSTHQEKTLKTA